MDERQRLKGYEVYASLLNCYADEKSVEKAESVMQKLGDMGFDRSPFCYNILLNLYCRIGSREKVDSLMHEMEEKGCCNEYTFAILSSAYAAASDSDGIDGIVEKIESYPRVMMNYSYAIAADGYLKVGQLDRALEMLKKLEGHIATEKRKSILFPILLTLYTKTGNKDELYRIWNLYKENVKIYNKGYLTMVSSLSKFNDIEGAEKIFKEWKSRGLSYDFRIPNFLIDAYSRNGHLGKAEALLHNGIQKGGNPDGTTWYYLTGGYILDNQVPKAAEALKKAIMVLSPRLRLSKDTLVTCLEYLEGKGDVDRAEEFISLLRTEGLFSAAVRFAVQKISPVGDPRDSVVPVLDQWVQEGRFLDRTQLRLIIKELKVYSASNTPLSVYIVADQEEATNQPELAHQQVKAHPGTRKMVDKISQWMSDKRYIPLSNADAATRLLLIFRVHGLEQAEKYFNNLHKELKGFEVYTALLNCYAEEKSVEKAESFTQQLRDMGFDRTPLCYNILLNLYYHIGSREKLDSLMHEMEEEGCYDDHTLAIRLSAYASASDSDGIDSIVEKMESDPRVIMKGSTYAIAADGYFKVGQLDRALEMLKNWRDV
ncbi:hypothetical protein C3L33_06233, partial [Rhododendron williamsianum]